MRLGPRRRRAAIGVGDDQPDDRADPAGDEPPEKQGVGHHRHGLVLDGDRGGACRGDARMVVGGRAAVGLVAQCGLL